MTNAEPGRDGPHTLWARIQTLKPYNEWKTTSAFKSIDQMFQKGEPVSTHTITGAIISANKESKNNPSNQTKTKETKGPKKVTFAEAPPGEGSPKSNCRKFSHEIRDAYEKMDMWYTIEDEDRFEVDFSSYRAMKELEKETEAKPKVTVQRRKFPHKQIVPCAKPTQQQIQSLDPPKAVSTPKEPHSSPATQQDKPRSCLQPLRWSYSN